jgi:hypothetical protein
MPRFSFHAGRPQRLAALLLLVFLGECLWLMHNDRLSTDDYRYAQCGREMWEKPSPLAGYFTSCGNMNGDGTLAYRLAGLPLTLQRITLQTTDLFRKKEDKLYGSGSSLNGSTWEARHEISSSTVLLLMHLPFALVAMWLGGGLWWVARRLFGNEGGFLALALYVFSPTVLRYSIRPNNEVLAMWGLYGLVYTAIGVAHALQGPRRKWRPRIVLLTIALALTAMAHLLAAIVGFVAAMVFMLYVAERRRSAVMPILISAAMGTFLLLLADYAFRLAAFSYVITGGGARFWFSLVPLRHYLTDIANAPTVIATVVALLLWFGVRRSRYLGNTTPLLMTLAIAPLVTTQVVSYPVLWALPFLFTFVGGVFADALETRHRQLFLLLTGGVAITQALLALSSFPALLAH